MNVGKNHLYTYITNYLISNDEKIKRIREKYKIPLEGFDVKKITETVFYPIEWYYFNKYKELEKMNKFIEKEFSDFLYPSYISTLIHLYIVFNDLEFVLKNEKINNLRIVDNVEQSKLFQQYISNHQYVTKELIIASDEEDALRYPISISFTADITRTALKKYIDQHWDTVSTLIEKYKTTSKSVLLKRGTRSSDLKSNLRKMFIFQNRNLDADALRKMLAKQFDYRISVEQIRSEKSKILKGK